MAEKLWGGADPDLPELVHLREKLRGVRHGFD
jgi:hypothetical protein